MGSVQNIRLLFFILFTFFIFKSTAENKTTTAIKVDQPWAAARSAISGSNTIYELLNVMEVLRFSNKGQKNSLVALLTKLKISKDSKLFKPTVTNRLLTFDTIKILKSNDGYEITLKNKRSMFIKPLKNESGLNLLNRTLEMLAADTKANAWYKLMVISAYASEQSTDQTESATAAMYIAIDHFFKIIGSSMELIGTGFGASAGAIIENGYNPLKRLILSGQISCREGRFVLTKFEDRDLSFLKVLRQDTDMCSGLAAQFSISYQSVCELGSAAYSFMEQALTYEGKEIYLTDDYIKSKLGMQDTRCSPDKLEQVNSKIKDRAKKVLAKFFEEDKNDRSGQQNNLDQGIK